MNHAALVTRRDDGTLVLTQANKPRDAWKRGARVTATMTVDELSAPIVKEVHVRRLTTQPRTMAPVLGVARTFADDETRFDVGGLPMLGVVLLLRTPRWTRPLAALAEQFFESWVHQRGSRAAPTCSELGYRCFDEARPARTDPYAIEFDPHRRLPRVVYRA